MSNVCLQNKDFGVFIDESIVNNDKSANENIVRNDINSALETIISPSITLSTDITYGAVTVTTAQLQDLYLNGPLEILAAPGAGLMYIVHGCALSIDEGGTVFNEDFQYSLMSLVYKAENNPSLCMIQGAFFLDYTGDRTTYANGYIINVDKSYVYTDDYVNKPVAIYPTGNFQATGGSTRLRVHVWYTIIDASF